jgi:hypothetical protein
MTGKTTRRNFLITSVAAAGSIVGASPDFSQRKEKKGLKTAKMYM